MPVGLVFGLAAVEGGLSWNLPCALIAMSISLMVGNHTHAYTNRAAYMHACWLDCFAQEKVLTDTS